MAEETRGTDDGSKGDVVTWLLDSAREVCCEPKAVDAELGKEFAMEETVFSLEAELDSEEK